jgi:hypothetical protein
MVLVLLAKCRKFGVLMEGRFFPFMGGGGSSTQAWMPTYVSILRIPQMIRVWRATVE